MHMQDVRVKPGRMVASRVFSTLRRWRSLGCSQRWVPSEYNPRALGVSLGISGHRTDLVKS